MSPFRRVRAARGVVRDVCPQSTLRTLKAMVCIRGEVLIETWLRRWCPSAVAPVGQGAGEVLEVQVACRQWRRRSVWGVGAW